VHCVTHARRELASDFPIEAGLSRRFDSAVGDRHAPLRVDEGPFFLAPRRSREHDIGKLGRLRHEDVLHREELELLERHLGVVTVGVRDNRVLPHDVHPLEVARVHLLHHLRGLEPELVVEGHAPRLFEFLPVLFDVHVLVARVRHRQRAEVRGALDVVLSSQRVQPRTRPAELSAGQCEVDDAVDVVDAVR